MSMRANEHGIDWERIRPEDFDTVADAVYEIADACETSDFRKYGIRHHEKIETRGGRTLCLECAANRLAANNSKWQSTPVARALQNAYPAMSRKAALSAHNLEEAAA